MRVAKRIIALSLAAVLYAAPAGAASLWSEGASLFSDRKASTIGDILMVKVSESVSDKDEGKTSSTKTTDENIKSGIGILSFIRAFGFGSASNMSGNTKVERTKTVNTQISCLVIDVMPNGNMVIQGDKTMLSGAEKMSVTFTGVVRPQDVAHNNTVDSARVANAEVTVSGKGIISRTQRPGIINQILQAIF
ncbi:MAG: flagellar basal body L-ring protein FlgH [Synergistaceae bacterium]|jgi:flagellar L-ring protein precursor FlgH|nr:flagellar basal body L-ring protein FlgH [Synergistaceae bacterium]